MARCHGTTVSGDRCKREVAGGERYCYAHEDQAEEGAAGAGGTDHGSGSPGERWTGADVLKAVLGVGVLGVIVLLRLRR